MPYKDSQANKDCIKKWHAENRDKVNANHKKWKENNPEKVKQENRDYALKNPEKRRASALKYRNKDPAKARERLAAWRKDNKEKEKEYRNQHGISLQTHKRIAVGCDGNDLLGCSMGSQGNELPHKSSTGDCQKAAA